jgi:4-hydroxy-2-oxoheptanedioate aldolase
VRVNETKARLRAGDTVFGCFVRYPDAGLVELLGYQGFDFLVLDAEHGTMEPRDCEHLVRAAELRGVTPLVRVPTNQPPAILRYLDTGAQGVHVPLVASAGDAESAVRAVKYWPRGARGLAGVRAAGYGQETSLGEYVARANDETLVVVQVETPAAVRAVTDIAAVDGVDVVFVGPTDLSHALGVPGRVDAPAVQEAFDEIVRRAAGAEVVLGILVPDAMSAAAWAARGARYVAFTIESVVKVGSQALLGARP